MTNETQALLSAIETLCGKKKARLLRRLAKAAMEAEQAQAKLQPWTYTYVGDPPGTGGDVTYTDSGTATIDTGTDATTQT